MRYAGGTGVAGEPPAFPAMDPNRWKQIDELVDAALDLPEGEREAFINSRANGDDDLKRAVIELIGAQSKTNEFLDNSAMKIVAKAIAIDEPREKRESLLGKKIATYRIEKLIGAGGMGEVYLAFDEKMRRNVALKILPAEFGSNDERVRRFEMEARAISKLNHPNIVTIYDVGNADGINYIATEFVEGKTLRDLIAGKFKLRNVMANSIQICDALSAAHAEGIIHRDIKPENIMIRKDGYAKILDFGVAKLTEFGPETVLKISHTTKGMIIGTPAYMSPAQVSGDPIDLRTDIWSCGVVLYEFLTGKHPFKGKNRQETFQAILSTDPLPPSEINPVIPEVLDRVLLKTLEKDPEIGYQTASDLRADLKRIKRDIDSMASGTHSGSYSTIGLSKKKGLNRMYIAIVAAATLILIGGLVTWALFFRAGARDRIEWSNATSIPLTDHKGTEFYPSLSPDGKSFVYASDQEGQFDIFYQRVGSKVPNNLTKGSLAEDTQPAFSPDGEKIAFRSERQPAGIYTIGVDGANLKMVADFGFHPSWSPDCKELVVSTFGLSAPSVRIGRENSLWAVNIETGAKRELLKEEASFPTWSPNGKRIAYWFYARRVGRRDIATIAADGSGEPVVITTDFAVSNWNPVWSPDGKFLYFVSDKAGNLNFWRVAIDENTGKTLSQPETVLTPSQYSRHLNFSRDGRRMIYVQTNNESNIKGVKFDEKAEKTVGEPAWITQGEREMVRAELSPDGTKFLLRLTRRTQDDIVLVNRDGTNWTDITNDAPFDRYPRWSRDGSQIAFASDRNTGYEIWICRADGTGLRQVTFQYADENGSSFPVWSPDGKSIIYSNDGRPHIVDVDRSWEEQNGPRRVFDHDPDTRFTVWDWSPDGTMLVGWITTATNRAIATYSFETKIIEPLVDEGDSIPSWLADSKRLVYDKDGKIFVINVETKKSKEILPGVNKDNVRAPFISRDGTLLYYTVPTTESNIWLLDLSPK
ncbi:MAG: protein kinase [Pyrinomonadaceae bacterium]